MKNTNIISELTPQTGRKKTIIPKEGEVWVRIWPGDRWVIENIYEKKIKNSLDVKKNTQTRILLHLEGEPRSTRDITLGTLKAWMNREDIEIIQMKETIEALRRDMHNRGMNEEEIKVMIEEFFAFDERKPKVSKLKRVK